jgi:hypothetical protein
MFNSVTIWILIPLAAIIGSFITKWYQLYVEAGRSHVDDKLVGELRDSIRRLEDRVSNLERAVTTAETERKYAL